MWKSIKATLQFELCNRFDQKIGVIFYKLIIILVLEKMCSDCIVLEISDDLKFQMIKKLARRISKLNKLLTQLCPDLNNNKLDYNFEFVQSTLQKSNQTIIRIKEGLEKKLNKTINDIFISKIDLEMIDENDYIHNLDDVIEKIQILSHQKPSALNLSKNFDFVKRNLVFNDFPDLNLISSTLIHLHDIEFWILYSNKYKSVKSTFQLFNLLKR